MDNEFPENQSSLSEESTSQEENVFQIPSESAATETETSETERKGELVPEVKIQNPIEAPSLLKESPTEILPLANHDIPLNQKEWREAFESLPEILYEDLKEKLEKGEKVCGFKVPFLNLDYPTEIEYPLLFEDCLIQGFVARGSTLKKPLDFRNCLFLERIQMNAQKGEEGFNHTTIEAGFRFHRCSFDEIFTMKNGNIFGEASFKECIFSKMLSFDKATFHQTLHFDGPGEMVFATLFSVKFEKGLVIQDYSFSGGDAISLDLNQIRLTGQLSFQNCSFQKKVDLKRAVLETERGQVWKVENCTFHLLDLRESAFHGEVQIFQSEFQEEILADIPRSQPDLKKRGHAMRSGRATFFTKDVAFLESKFKGKFSFQGVRFEQYFNVKNCVLEQGGSLNQCEFHKLVSFWDVQINGSIHFRKAHFMGRTQFGKVIFAEKSSFNEAVFEDELTFFDSKVTGDIYFTQAYFSKDIKFRNIEFQGGLGLEKITLEGDLNITGSEVKDRFILTESKLNNLNALAFSIGTWGSIAKCIIHGEVLLDGLRVGTQIENVVLPQNDPIEKEIVSESEEKETSKTSEKTVVPGTLYLDETTFHKEVHLAKARIKGKLSLEQVNTYAEMDLTNMTLGNDLVLSKSYFRSMVHFDGTQCQQIDSKRSRYKEEVSFNRIQCHEFSLTGSSFDGGFTMRSAEVGRTLSMNNVDVDGKIDLFKCVFQRIFFHNLIADHFLIDREVLGKQLSSEAVGNYLQAKNEYGILKQSFLQRSQYQEMDWAYYRFCRASRKEKKMSLFHPFRSVAIFLEWLFLDIGFGYGTRPMNIAVVALLFILGFAFLFWSVPYGVTGGNGQPLSQMTFIEANYLSVVTFASMDYGDCYPAFNHWLKYWFSLEGLLGIFLTTLFVATISRKIIRT